MQWLSFQATESKWAGMGFLSLPMLETGTILQVLTNVILSPTASKLYGITLLDDNFLSMKE